MRRPGNGFSRSDCAIRSRWARSIAAGKDPEASGYEGLVDLAAAFGINESAALGRAVTVQEVLDGSVAAYQADIDRHYRLVQVEPEGTTLARGEHS